MRKAAHAVKQLLIRKKQLVLYLSFGLLAGFFSLLAWYLTLHFGVFLLKDENGAAENPVCLRCGKCVTVCPMRLQPLYMYRYVNAGRLDRAQQLHIFSLRRTGT